LIPEEDGGKMADPFIGEIKIVSFNFAMRGWAMCNGQLMPISQNQALFSLLGTTYGGDGRTTFGLPNLQGNAPVHRGSQIVQGERGGETAHTLTLQELPTHTHVANGTTNPAAAGGPGGNIWATVSGINAYSSSSNTTMLPSVISNAGGSQPHANLQPYLVLNFLIALTGIFPSQN
jgi:microcystin-dependent protein